MDDQDIVLVTQDEEQIALGVEENEEIRLSAEESQSENFALGVGENEETILTMGEDDAENFALDFGEVIDGTTQDFNKLYNRPSYDGEVMTSETNIPKVIHYQAGENVTITGNVISADKVQVDDAMSATSTNPVQNKVVYANLATKVDSDDLSEVAYTGNYNDLINEPENFTQDDWALLWRV